MQHFLYFHLLKFKATNCIYPSTGAIPGPVLYGSLFDSACVLWQESDGESGSQSGSCFYYNVQQLGIYVLVVTTCLKAVSCVFLLLAWLSYKAPRPPIDSQVITIPKQSTSLNRPNSVFIEENVLLHLCDLTSTDV